MDDEAMEEGEFEFEEGESMLEYSGDDSDEAPQLIPAGDPKDLESESDFDIQEAKKLVPASIRTRR